MQSLPQESRPTLPFTYCLFVDDHFPSELELPLSLETPSPPPKPSFKSLELLNEALTQTSSVCPGVKGASARPSLGSPVRPGFLSEKESNSDPESFDVANSSNEDDWFTEENFQVYVKETSSTYKVDSIKGLGKLETSSLELYRSDSKAERKSGFSIWSFISPGLGMRRSEDDALSNAHKRKVKVTSNKLRKALRNAHFVRIENKLKSLLNRERSKF